MNPQIYRMPDFPDAEPVPGATMHPGQDFSYKQVQIFDKDSGTPVDVSNAATMDFAVCFWELEDGRGWVRGAMRRPPAVLTDAETMGSKEVC